MRFFVLDIMVDGPQFTDNQQRQRHLEMSAASAEPVGIRGWPDNTNCTSEPLLQSHSVLSDSAGWHFFWSLLFFFVTSTLLTKMGSKRKKKIEDGYKEGGQRNWVQVICQRTPQPMPHTKRACGYSRSSATLSAALWRALRSPILTLSELPPDTMPTR